MKKYFQIVFLFGTILLVMGCEGGGSVKTAASDTSPEPAPGFTNIDAFERGDARIALGQTRQEVREELAKGKTLHMVSIVYVFRTPDPEMFEQAVWDISYGRENPGMGRKDVLRIHFKEDKVWYIEHKAYMCP